MEINEAVTILSSLAQEMRLRIFRMLVKAGEDGLCAGDISRELDIPKNTLSFHLKELANAKLISSERNGRSIIYRLRSEDFRGLMMFLAEDCCAGRPDLCLPNACAEDSCTEERCSEDTCLPS